jgi:F-type H+-transporting ATPase subunit epsilon
MPKTQLDITTAERTVFSEEVESVVVPGAEGQLGILPRHAPLLTLLQPGELRIRKDGDEIIMAITGGFMEVLSNRVIVLADAAERADEIDEARAEAGRQRALALLKEIREPADLAAATAALRRSQIRLRVIQRRRREQQQQSKERHP